MDVFASLEAPSVPGLVLRFYGGFSHRHDHLLTPFPAPLPSLENGGGGYREGGAENVKLLIMA